MADESSEGRRDQVAILIAAYNESEAIGAVVLELRAAGWDVIVVDDGSTDGTAAIARRAGADVLRHAINQGQGAAIATGIAFALAAGPRILVTFDADGQHSVRDLPVLVQPILADSADVVLGSRFLGRATGLPWHRRLLLRIATVFTRLMTGLAVTDTHNGLRAVSGRVAASLHLTQNGMAHASEWLEEIARVRARVREVPVNISYTDYSMRKGQRSSHAFAILRDYLLG